MSMRIRRALASLTTAAGIGVALAVTVGGGGPGSASPSASLPIGQQRQMVPEVETGDDKDCLGDQTVSVAEASEKAKFHVFSPPRATEFGEVDRVVWCGEAETVLFRYTSGVMLTQKTAETLTEGMAGHVEAQLLQNPVAQPATVRGLPAYVIESGQEAYESAREIEDVYYPESPEGEPGAVVVADKGTWITLIGNHKIGLPALVSAVEGME